MDPNSPLVAALSGEYARRVIRARAKYLSRCSGFSRHEVEDLEREILLKLLRRIERYDGRVPLNVYIAKLARWAAGEIRRKRLRWKQGGGKRPRSLDAPRPVAHLGGEEGIVGSYVPEAVHATWLDKFHRVLAGAAPDDAAVAQALILTGSVLGASRELGVSRRQVENAMERLRELFDRSDLE